MKPEFGRIDLLITGPAENGSWLISALSSQGDESPEEYGEIIEYVSLEQAISCARSLANTIVGCEIALRCVVFVNGNEAYCAGEK